LTHTVDSGATGSGDNRVGVWTDRS
jgi:hypothetical protein